MSALHAFLLQLVERRKADRRAPTLTTSVVHAEQLIRETKYTGIAITHYAEGHPKRIEFPHPVGIELTK